MTDLAAACAARSALLDSPWAAPLLGPGPEPLGDPASPACREALRALFLGTARVVEALPRRLLFLGLRARGLTKAAAEAFAHGGTRQPGPGDAAWARLLAALLGAPPPARLGELAGLHADFVAPLWARLAHGRFMTGGRPDWAVLGIGICHRLTEALAGAARGAGLDPLAADPPLRGHGRAWPEDLPAEAYRAAFGLDEAGFARLAAAVAAGDRPVTEVHLAFEDAATRFARIDRAA